LSTITVHRSDVTSQEVVRALRYGLGSRYSVEPGLRLAASSFMPAQQAQHDEIVVSSGSVLRAQVSVANQAGTTTIRVQPGGLFWIWLVNEFGIARKVRHVLENAPGLAAR
jgi:hypothetical protein